MNSIAEQKRGVNVIRFTCARSLIQGLLTTGGFNSIDEIAQKLGRKKEELLYLVEIQRTLASTDTRKLRNDLFQLWLSKQCYKGVTLC
jgi:hypothetical protein